MLLFACQVLPPETRRLLSLTIGCVGALKGRSHPPQHIHNGAAATTSAATTVMCRATDLPPTLLSLLFAPTGLVIVQAVVPKMSLRISSAALGAAWVAEAIADILGKAVEARSGFNFNLA